MCALKMIWKYSRVLRVVDIIFGVFWFVQFARDEFVKVETAARMRVIDFLPSLPWWVWLIGLYLLLLMYCARSYLWLVQGRGADHPDRIFVTGPRSKKACHTRETPLVKEERIYVCPQCPAAPESHTA
jgi:hypothetical protein